MCITSMCSEGLCVYTHGGRLAGIAHAVMGVQVWVLTPCTAEEQRCAAFIVVFIIVTICIVIVIRVAITKIRVVGGVI